MIVLKKLEDSVKITIVLNEDCNTWMEVTERFINFLQASGYIVQGIDVAEYLMGQYSHQKETKEELISRSVDLMIAQHKKNKKKKKG